MSLAFRSRGRGKKHSVYPILPRKVTSVKLTVVPQTFDLSRIALSQGELDAKYSCLEDLIDRMVKDQPHSGEEFDLIYKINDLLGAPRSIEDFHHRLKAMKERERYMIESAQKIRGMKLVPWDGDAKTIKPNSLVTLYHGTGEEWAKRFLKDGIDVRFPPKSRQYYGTDVDKWGIYASPEKGVAGDFGSYILEFSVPAQHLEQPAVYRQGNESFVEADEQWRKQYPGSFRPSLSSYLEVHREPQAIVKINVPPQAIRSVTYYDRKREEWVTVPTKEWLRSFDDK